MNRYILFLTLISLQAQISCSAISENAQSWEHYKKEVLENNTLKIFMQVLHKFEKKFDLIISTNNLNQEQLEYATTLKYTCNNNIEKLFDASNVPESLDTQQIKVLKSELEIFGMMCIAELAQGQAEYEYEQYTIPQKMYDKTIQEEIGKEIRDETFKAALQEIPSSCSYLIDNEAFKKNLQQKIDKFHKNKG